MNKIIQENILEGKDKSFQFEINHQDPSTVGKNRFSWKQHHGISET
jgi:hypothetical protein